MTTDMLTMMNAVAALFVLDTGDNQTMRSFHILDTTNFPEAVGETDIPIALTYVDGLEPTFSRGGPCIDTWNGYTELFLSKSLDKKGLAKVAAYLPRVRNVMAANMKLGGIADLFAINKNIQPPIERAVLKYGTTMHYGIIVHWTCKLGTAGITVGDPSVPA